MGDRVEIPEETAYDSTLADAKEFAGRSHIRSITNVRILCEECAVSKPPENRTCSRSTSVRDSQDFEDGCFQPRARLAAQSLGLAALANSLTPCLVIGLSHKWVRHGMAGQLRWIFRPSEPPTYGHTAHRCTASRV